MTVEATELGYNPEHRNGNLRLLRLYLKMTQKEFIGNYLTDETGKPLLSVASLSNLEARGGPQLNNVVLRVSEKLSFNAMLFSLPPEQFIDSLKVNLESGEVAKVVSEKPDSSQNVSRLINTLTMHFADEIFNGRLKRGDQIEPERVLAQKLNVGRSSIREALKILHVLGMIDIRPGQGTFLSGTDENFFVIPLSWSLFLDGIQVQSILEVRDILEQKAAELAAQSQDEVKMAKLGEVFQECRKAYEEHDVKRFLELDIEFHIAIADLSGNPIILAEIQTIRNLLKHVSETGMASDEQVRQIFLEHQKIYGSIISCDAKQAKELMASHIVNSSFRYGVLPDSIRKDV